MQLVQRVPAQATLDGGSKLHLVVSSTLARLALVSAWQAVEASAAT